MYPRVPTALPSASPRSKAPLSIYSTLHSPSREIALGNSAAHAVEIKRKDEVSIPPHLAESFRLLNANLDTLEKMFRRVNTFTQTEIFMAAAKGAVLFESQRQVLAEVVRCCESEIKFLTSKLLDSAEKENDLFASPEEKSATVGWQCIYSTIAGAARVCNAETAALFVLDKGLHDKKPESAALVEKEQSMRMAALVSAHRLTPLDNGTLHLDVLEVVQSVAETKCSVNAKSSQNIRKAKTGFDTILACPIFIPQSDGAVCGVIVLLNRIVEAKNAAKSFSHEDEGRLFHVAEVVAEILWSFQLATNGSEFISPTSWENTWNVATHEDAVLRPSFRETVARGFVYRDNGVAPTTSAKHIAMQSSKQRTAIAPSTVLVDVIAECDMLQQSLENAKKEIDSKNLEIAEAGVKMQSLKLDVRNALKQAEEMRMSNERLLRHSFVTPLPVDSSPPTEISLLDNPGRIDGRSMSAEGSLDDYISTSKQRGEAFQSFNKVSKKTVGVGPQSARRAKRL